MNTTDPIILFYGDMDKLGPGSDADTLAVLHMLPEQAYKRVVDAGCGTGRQTLVLAKHLHTMIHAIDIYPAFLERLNNRAKAASIDQHIETHCMDMANIPAQYNDIDLLWSEAAAYSMGFHTALQHWYPSIKAGGILVVSELCWTGKSIPVDVQHFFDTEYPEMKSLQAHLTFIQQSDYELLATHTLAADTWFDGYYDLLEPKAMEYINHPEQSVRDYASAILQEIQVFRRSDNSYSYVFFILKKPA